MEDETKKFRDRVLFGKFNVERFLYRVLDLSGDSITSTWERWFYVVSVDILESGPRFNGTEVFIKKTPEGKLISLDFHSDSSYSVFWDTIENDKLRVVDDLKAVSDYLGKINIGELFHYGLRQNNSGSVYRGLS